MNLDQIATKCFILALFIRDDGERLLLGDGYYDFNQKLQHFQANTIANDVVEIQGDSGQLLAGQVMRSGAQKFEGYIGDATTNRQTIEQKRSDFMAFFRIKHFYKVIYIFPDGTAIQRRRGYLTDAPTIPEIFQKFPEYSVALNFEDANYYEYAEDEHGDEIYAHIIELALSGNATGGLIWDEIGAVSNGISWSGIQTAQGEYINITNELDIPAKLASVEMLGNATQDGTPTPDSPVPISVVTGENTVKITGKNLLALDGKTFPGGTAINIDSVTSNSLSISSTSSAGSYASRYVDYPLPELGLKEGDTFTISMDITGTYTGANGASMRLYWNNNTGSIIGVLESNSEPLTLRIPMGTTSISMYWYVRRAAVPTVGATATFTNIQLELGSTATAYEPYQGQSYGVNLGKNLFSGFATLSTGSIYDNDTGTLVLTTSSTNTSNDIPAKPNTAYYLNFTTGASTRVYIREYDGAGNMLVNTTKYVPYGFTTDANTAFVRIYFSPSTSEVFPVTIKDIQLEQSATPTDYAPYFTPLELAKIGNYQDRIYKADGKWYIEKNTAKIASYAGETISTDYISTTGSLTTGATVYYALATPTTTEITNETLIAQLEALGASSLYIGVNNIRTETLNAMPTLKIEYYTEYTLEGAGYEWEPGGNTAKTIVTVAGVDSAWPIWTIQGGAQNPTLTNITTGQTISWHGFVPEGQTLTINMAEMTADLAGANVFEYITGEWLRLAPGNNTLVYNAGNADKPSTLSWNGVLA